MENKSNKGLVALIIILLITVIGLGGFIAYDKVLNKPTKKVVEKKVEKKEKNEETYDYSTVKGVYTFKGEADANGEYELYTLSLNEDGLYHYESAKMVEEGTIGNYTIVGNEIHLNQIFTHGSDAALSVGLDNKVLKISSKDEIIDETAPIVAPAESSIGKITLKRDSEKEMSDFSNYFNNLEIFNNMHQK